MPDINKRVQKLRKVFNDVRRGCECENIEYCPGRRLIASMPNVTPRLLEQHKLVEEYKLFESQKKGKNIGWEEAYSRWAKDGHAELFGDIYKEGMLNNELFHLVFYHYNLIDSIRKRVSNDLNENFEWKEIYSIWKSNNYIKVFSRISKFDKWKVKLYPKITNRAIKDIKEQLCLEKKLNDRILL